MHRRLARALPLLALAFVLAAPATAWAHVPVLEPARVSREPLTVPAPVASMALYGYLHGNETVDAYAFTPSRSVDTTVGIIVPVRGGLADFHPDVTILGPDDAPVLELSGTPGERRTFFEPFSLESFYQGPEAPVTLAAGKRYVLEVGHGSGEVREGAYVVTFSGDESFSPADTLRSLVDVPRVWLGLYGGGPLRPIPTAVAVLLLLLVALLIGRTVARRHAASSAEDGG